MSRNDSIAKLKRLQAETDRIRNKLGIGAPNEVLYLASLDWCSDAEVVVEADGFGGGASMRRPCRLARAQRVGAW